MRFIDSTRRVFALILCALASAALALAQFESATVLGTVHDPSKAVISAAAVTLVNVETGVSVQTATDCQRQSRVRRPASWLRLASSSVPPFVSNGLRGRFSRC